MTRAELDAGLADFRADLLRAALALAGPMVPGFGGLWAAVLA